MDCCIRRCCWHHTEKTELRDLSNQATPRAKSSRTQSENSVFWQRQLYSLRDSTATREVHIWSSEGEEQRLHWMYTRIPSIQDEGLLAQWRAGQRHPDGKGLSLATPEIISLDLRNASLDIPSRISLTLNPCRRSMRSVPPCQYSPPAKRAPTKRPTIQRGGRSRRFQFCPPRIARLARQEVEDHRTHKSKALLETSNQIYRRKRPSRERTCE